MFAAHSDERNEFHQDNISNRFPVLHYGPVPELDLKNWKFRLGRGGKAACPDLGGVRGASRTKLTMDRTA